MRKIAIFISVLILASQLGLHAQEKQNYVVSKVYLDEQGNSSQTSVQYFDGLDCLTQSVQ